MDSNLGTPGGLWIIEHVRMKLVVILALSFLSFQRGEKPTIWLQSCLARSHALFLASLLSEKFFSSPGSVFRQEVSKFLQSSEINEHIVHESEHGNCAADEEQPTCVVHQDLLTLIW